MNIQATLEPDTDTNDLQLRFVGGKNDGESVSISSECCMLGVTRRTADRGSVKDQCAIYRGPAGVAVQSHGSEVLINGEAKSVHWLQIGDRIQLSSSQAVEVVQLGCVQKEYETPEADLPAPEPVYDEQPAPAVVKEPLMEAQPVFAEAEPCVDTFADAEPVLDAEPAGEAVVETLAEAVVETITDSVDVEGDRIDFVSNTASEEYVAEDSPVEVQSEEFSPAELSSFDQDVQNESSADEPPATPVIDASQISEVVTDRFESLETSVNQLHHQATNVDRRFDRLEDSLNALTEHLERLAVSSLSRDSVASESAEPAAFVADPVQSTFADHSFSDPAASSNVDALVPAEPSVESVIDSLDAPVEVTPDSAAEPEAVAPSENYGDSIASLFNDLAKTAEPAVVPAVESTLQPVAEPLQEETESFGNDVPDATSLVDATAVVQESSESDAQLSAPSSLQSDTPEEVSEPEIENDDLAAALANVAALTADVTDPVSEDVVAEQSVVAVEEPAVVESPEEPAGAFTEQMMESMQSDTPTLSSSELAQEVGLGIAQPVEVPEITDAPARAEVRTESVAEIFSRLQAGTAASESGVGELSTAPAAQQSVQTTFEDIQASISAGLDEEVAPLPQADMASNAVSAEQVAVPEIAPVQPADDVDSVMERLRASIENDDVASEETEPLVDAKKEDSVDDYMSMLLSRMKGDSGPPDAGASPAATDATALESQPEAEKGSDGPMTQEEFMPRQKAMPIKSLDKMRELANSTSRSAVQRSVRAQQEERKKSLILQSLSLGSLTLAAVMFATKAYTFGAAFTTIFAVTTGYLFYQILRPIGGPETTKSNTASQPSKNATDSVPDAEA